MREKPASRDGAIAQIAARQHGVVTAAQLLKIGLDKSAISRRVRVRRIHRIHRGVYAVGHPRLSLEGRCLAAALACGEGAVVSHRSAAILWGMLKPPADPSTVTIDVTEPTAAGRARRSGVVLHRSTCLGQSEVTRRLGVPVTTPGRTLRDVHRTLPAPLHQRAARRALDLGLVASDALGRDPDLTRSELERRFLALCRRHRLPRPQVNVRVGAYEVDFLWRKERLIVETDGFRHHGTRAAFESDRARDARLQALGYRVLRFTYRQVCESRQSVIESLRSIIGSGPT